MDIEKLKLEAQRKALHIADVSGSALFNADCMDILPLIPDKSVQLILADLPYGTTSCEWDVVLPLNKLFEQYKRMLADNGNIVLFGSQPFSTDLIIAGRDIFRYELIWDKISGKNIFEAKRKPLKAHENILVFYKSSYSIYNPQMELAQAKNKRDRVKNYKKATLNSIYGEQKEYTSLKDEDLRYPNSIYIHSFQGAELHQTKRIHPTQKPLQLIKWLISSYSNENDYVLDNTMGVGTTCLGAKELNRKFIGIEKEIKYYDLAVGRIFQSTESIYKNIQSKENYDKLLSSGMFWEFHPELSGNWDSDKVVVCQHCH